MKPLLKNVLKLLCKHLDVQVAVLIRNGGEFSDVVEFAALDNADEKKIAKEIDSAKFPRNAGAKEYSENECCLSIKEKLALRSVQLLEVYNKGALSYFLALFAKEEKKIEIPKEFKSLFESAISLGETPPNEEIKNYTRFVEWLKVPAALVDTDGKLIFTNNAFETEFNSGKAKRIDEVELLAENGDAFDFKEAFENEAEQSLILTTQEGDKFFKVVISGLQNFNGDNAFLFLFAPVTKFISELITYNQALENVDVVLYSMKADGSSFDFISPAVIKIFGFNPEDLIQNKITLLKKIRRSEYPKVRKFLADLQDGKPSVIEYGIVDSKGEERFIRHSGIPIVQQSKIEKIVGAIIDVTSEVQLRENLRYSEEKFKLLMETMEDLIFTLDDKGNFLLINKNGSQLLGYTVEEMLGRHFLEFVAEDNKSEVAVAFQDILKSDNVVRFEAKLLDTMGQEIIFEIQARSIKSGNKINGMMAIGRDMTQRIKYEQELKDLNSKLIEANRIISIERDRAKEKISLLEELNRMKNEFISNVSHELRTPLASIVGFAEAISSDAEMPRETITEFNNIIYSEGKRLARLINDLLDFSKLESEGEHLEKTDFDLVPVLKEVVESFTQQAEEKGIVLNASVPEAEIILHGDKERIKNAIAHVVSNAVKFTNKGGRVSIMLNNFLHEVEIIISDTGIGIPKEDIPKLFQKFSKVNRPGNQIPGAGIGLAMTKKIIDLHNGLINVKSKVNEGTTFIIRLPKKV